MLAAEKEGAPPKSEDGIVTVTIPSAEIREEGTTAFYHINVVGSFSSWSVCKRFSQFEEMHNYLVAEFAHSPLPKGVSLPPKKLKWISSHVAPEFVEERRVLLQNYLRKLIAHKDAAKSPTLKRFLTTDKERDDLYAEEKEAELPEDVEVTDVVIPSTRTMSDHVLYQVDVSNSRKRKTFSKWTVLKRFGQFFEMDGLLRERYGEDSGLPAPPERKIRLLNDHLDPVFVEERRALLEHYLQSMVKDERVVRDPDFLKFLGVQ